MKTEELFEDDKWLRVLSVLPPDLEQSARDFGCIKRNRKVSSAASLLRMVFAYALSDLSLKDIAAWARAEGVADLTAPALHYRLKNSEQWLIYVLSWLLLEGVRSEQTQLPIRIIDGSVITGPGSKGTDWVLHMAIDGVSGTILSVEFTDSRGAESFLRHSVNPGEVVLGDRMYSTAVGIDHVVKAGAFPVVRVHRRILKICNLNKQRIYLESFESEMSEGEGISLDVMIPIPPDMTGKKSKAWHLKDAQSWIPARMVGLRTKKEVIWVLTTLSREILSDDALLSLFRLRWQVELAFKRLKSLLNLDALPTKDGPTARSWLLGRLIVAAVAQFMVSPTGLFSPPGHARPSDCWKPQRLVQIPDNAVGPESSHIRRRNLGIGNQFNKPRYARQFKKKAKDRST